MCNGTVARRKEFKYPAPAILAGLILFAAAQSPATEVKLANGQVYKDVTIVNRSNETLQFRGASGTLKVRMQSVESIDGVSPTGFLPLKHPTATPAAAPPSASAPAPAPPQTSGSIPVADSDQAPETSPVPAETPAPPKWPAPPFRWNMEMVLLALAAFSGLWLGTVGWVQRDLFQRRRDPRFWTNIAILLPGVGCLIYAIARRIGIFLEKQKAKKAPRNVNETVAEREHKWVKTMGAARRGFEFLDQDRKAVLIKNAGELSGIETAHDVLEEALMERASDVHIEPSEDSYRVRFRIDGIMHPRMNFELGEGQRLSAALKTLAQIDVAEKRKAQDGRFRVRTGESDIDFRVATANSIFGEKLVIRILDRKAGVLGLGDLGMSDAMRVEFARVIHSSSGMILATGPTGSGKTSTLYSALSQLDATRLNIMTIEDPAEYELTGATQIPVNAKAGVTYESGLRSLLRQDPDVIFVGEMRDREAAQIALRAALTGHLLFSSLHTKDAVGTILRLEEMGIEHHLLSSALLMVVAQRLVRVLCPACRESYTCGGNELDDIGIGLPAGEPIFRPKGCGVCNHTGYVGRTGIFEMIVFDEEMRQAVSNGLGETALRELARTKGFRGYREEGAQKILSGVTSVEEILQAT
jgi:type II secretory ATPase GspE/PulE/Tfp pilus assembly ATPase PilB-like protein